jgi:hypothetical protein
LFLGSIRRSRLLASAAVAALSVGVLVANTGVADAATPSYSAAGCATYSYTNPYIGLPTVIPKTTVSYGSTGNCVAWVQQTLNNAQGYGLAVDGIFGSGTLAAVKNFQSKFSACTGGVDGVAGPKTDSCALADAAGGI